jgi:hypothetical protein
MSISFKEKAEIVESVLASIAILIGGVWGGIEYAERKNQERISKSFEIMAEFRESEDFRHYSEFTDSTKVNNILHNKSLNGTEKSKRIAKLHTDKVKNQLKSTIELYESAVVCVTVDHCDKNIIAAFASLSAHRAYIISYEVIEELRRQRNDRNYADELPQISKWYCTLPESVDHKLKPVLWCKGKDFT